MSFIQNVMDNIKSNMGKAEAKEPVMETQTSLPKTPVKFEFMEHYTFVDPRKVMTNYDLFELCEKVPVACETDEDISSGFYNCKEIPTKIALEFAHMLEKTPAEKIAPKAMRTISIIHTQKGKNIVIMPDLTFANPVLIWDTSAKPGTRGTWFLDTTPEINRAIVEATKIHTR